MTVYERYSIVHIETYLKIDNDEFLMLLYFSMTTDYIPTVTEIQKVTDYITGETEFKSEIENSGCLSLIFLHKEDNKWKFLGDSKRAMQFITDKNLDPKLTELLKYSPNSATVISTVNNSGNRVYEEH